MRVQKLASVKMEMFCKAGTELWLKVYIHYCFPMLYSSISETRALCASFVSSVVVFE